MKKLFVGCIAFFWMSCAVAQDSGVIAVAEADEFLGPTYAIPDAPVFVDLPSGGASNRNVLTEIFGSDAVTLNANDPIETVSGQNFEPTPGLYRPKKNVLTKLPDLPAPQLMYESVLDTTITPVIRKSDYADRFLESLQNGKRVTFSVPREIRISFYPGQSSLSAQALKWIKAFALKVRNDPRLVIEIRVSEKDWSLQSKRVALMLQSVMEQGVSRHQIFIYKTNRSSDSVLLGYGYSVDKELEKGKKKQKTITW